MAETGTRPEIEDVLSSIRRLVSQDTRPSVTVKALTSAPDTLVLTPAQLVTQDAPDEVSETPGANTYNTQVNSPEKMHGSPVGEVAPGSASELQSDLAATGRRTAPMSAPQDWEPDFDDSAAQDWPHAETLVAQLPSDGAGLGDELTRLEDTIARLEAEVSLSETEFESETGDPFVADGMAPLADLPESFDEAALISEAPDAALFEAPVDEVADSEAGAPSVPEPATTEDVTPADNAVDPSEMDPDLQHGDWAESAQDDPHWPDLSDVARIEDAQLVETGAAPRRLHLGDAAEVHFDRPQRASSYETMREDIAIEDEFPELADLDQDGAGDDSDLIDAALPIDEEALHALVSDLIRKELQGAMGARITRNVRKLVRREIQRALIGRDLE